MMTAREIAHKHGVALAMSAAQIEALERDILRYLEHHLANHDKTIAVLAHENVALRSK